MRYWTLWYQFLMLPLIPNNIYWYIVGRVQFQVHVWLQCVYFAIHTMSAEYDCSGAWCREIRVELGENTGT